LGDFSIISYHTPVVITDELFNIHASIGKRNCQVA